MDGLLHISIAIIGIGGIWVAFAAGLRRVIAVPHGSSRAWHYNFASLTAGAVLAAAAVLGACNFYVYHGFNHQPDIYRRGDRASRMVAITFDDGPSDKFTPPILDILREHDVTAAFFLIGAHAEKYPEIARRIAEEGHEIGNHTQNHRNVPTLGYWDLEKEVIEATASILAATDRYPDFIRPPRGMYDGRFRRLAHVLGQRTVLWSLSSQDWRRGATAESITKNILRRARGGEIILFHDNGALIRKEGGDRSATIAALPGIIAGLRHQGLEIVPLSRLLEESGSW